MVLLSIRFSGLGKREALEIFVDVCGVISGNTSITDVAHYTYKITSM